MRRQCTQVSNRLLERNRRLRGVHAQLARIVVGLMETDLVRQKVRCARLAALVRFGSVRFGYMKGKAA